MKKLFLLFISLSIFSALLAQKHNQDLNTKSSAMFWQNDFSDSLDWLFSNTNTVSANWIITSMPPQGQFSSSMGTMNSSTPSSFALYDSDANAFNSEVNTQNALLTYKGFVDCSNRNIVVFSFESYLLSWQESLSLEVSSDSLNWQVFDIHQEVFPLQQTNNTEFIQLNISSIAANQPKVYFRFRFQGNWDYAWMIDDVEFSEPTGSDVAIELPALFTQGLYLQTPKSQLPTNYQVKVKLENLGASTFSLIPVDVNIQGLFSFQEDYQGQLMPFNQEVFEFAQTRNLTPLDTGMQSIGFSIAMPDGNILNNQQTYTFRVTDTTLGYSYNATNFYPNLNDFSFAQKFELYQPDTLTSLSAYLYFDASCLNENYSLKLYMANANGQPGSMIAQTAFKTVLDSDTGETALGLYNLQFTNPLALQAGTYFVVFEDNLTGVASAMSSVHTDAPTTALSFDGNSWNEFGAFYASTFAMYMHVKSSTSEPLSIIGSSVLEHKIFPNPALQNEQLNIQTDQKIRQIELLSLSSKSIKIETYTGQKNSDMYKFGLPDLSSGIYLLKISSDSGIQLQKLIIK